ncbi:MAG: hypothetical protein QM691_07460 [Opitutaceae bacterium]
MFSGILWRDRKLLRYVLWTLPPVALYAAYNHLLYGAPWRTGYGNFSYDLTASVFAQHLGFYLHTSLQHLGPLLPFAFLGARRLKFSETAFLVAWPLSFLLFYSFWRSGGDAWWWSRFLLPSYAALFLLAAAGLEQIAMWAASCGAVRGTRPAFGALLVFVAGAIGYEIRLGLSSHDLWTRSKARHHHDLVCSASTLVPPNGFIGSIEFGSSVYLYTPQQPFFSGHSESPALVQNLLAQNIPVILLVEPWNHAHPEVSALRRAFDEELLTTMPMWGGEVGVYRLRLHRPPQ